MLHILEHTFLHTLELAPLLFITYLVMEYAEHKLDLMNQQRLLKGRFSVLVASLLGVVPQCGISAAAAELYSVRFITLGALVGVFFSSSDEMLPIFISGGVKLSVIAKVLLLKVALAIAAGYITNLIFKQRKASKGHIAHICEDEKCHCGERGIFLSALIHSLGTLFFIFIITFAFEIIIDYLGFEAISEFVLVQPYISSLVMPLIGLIPNCASSVFIAQMYLESVITPAAMIAGLLANSGVGLLVLFKTNRNIKENLKITAYLYMLSALCGIVLELLKLAF